MGEGLARYRIRSVRAQLLVGFVGGLPFALTSSTLTSWLQSAGVPLGAIGALSLVALPYSLKVLWAPLLDRYAPPLLGRRRGWMALFALAGALSVAVLGLCDPAHAPRGLAAAALVVAAVSASFDIVSDAWRADVLPADARAAGTAVYVLGYRAGLLTAGGLALVVADRLSFRAAYLGVAALCLLGVVAAVRAPEPPATRPPRTLAEAIVQPVEQWFSRPRALALLALIALFRVGDAVANGLVPPFLLELGFRPRDVGTWYRMVGMAATIAGGLWGGVLVPRLGLQRSLFTLCALQAATPLAYAALALAGPSTPLLALAVIADSLATGLSLAALDVLLLGLCDPRFSATQFAILTSAYGLLSRLLGGGAGVVAARLGWPLFFVATTAAGLPALALVVSLKDEIAGRLRP